MASAQGIKAGAAYVELSVKDSKLIKGLQSALGKLKAFGGSLTNLGAGLQAAGGKLLAVGAGMAAPLAVATKAFADVEQELANLRAAANPTAAEFDKIKNAVQSISQRTGQGPAAVAAVFTELLKAGMALQTVLNGGAEAALKFARVGGIDVAQAATIMNDALNVFAREGIDAAQVVDTFSKAADASSISISQIAESFSMSSAVFGAAGQTLSDLTSAVAILGNAGLKGSDAGTSLKTMMIALMAPAERGAKVMRDFGINVRDAAGNMLPLPQIIAEVAAKTQNLDAATRDDALRDLFGTDALRAGLLLLQQGATGWQNFSDKLNQSLTVSQKFAIMTDTLKGNFIALLAALQRIGAAIGNALSASFAAVRTQLFSVLSTMEMIVTRNPQLVQTFAQVTAAVLASGAALVTLGLTLKALGGFFAVASGLAAAFIQTVGFMLTPLGAAITLVAALGTYLVWATGAGGQALKWLADRFADLEDFALKSFQGIKDALAAGDTALAAKVLWTSLQLVWQTGVNALKGVWLDFKKWFTQKTSDIFYGAVVAVADALYSMQKFWSTTLNFWRDTLDRFIGFFKKRWNELTGWVADLWIGLTVDDPNEAAAIKKRIADDTRQRNLAIANQNLDARLSRERDLKDLEQERKQVLIEIAGIADKDDKERDAQFAKDKHAAEAALKTAREEFDDAVSAARQKSEEFELAAQPEASGPPEIKAPQIDLPKFEVDMPQVEQQLKKAFDVVGSFQATAFDRLGLGTSSAEERAAKAAEENAKHAKEIARLAKGDGIRVALEFQ